MPDAEFSFANLLGQQLANGRFLIRNLLGSGGMADVFRAWDRRRNQDVAVKFPKSELSVDPNFGKRFQREIKTMAKLSHQHIIPVLDVGEHNRHVFAVFPFLAGGTLKERIAGGNRLATPPLTAGMMRWLSEIASALDYLHDQRTLHRDVKPDNILFDAHGNAYLSDFGIVHALDPETDGHAPTVLTDPNMAIGTAPYMAPELILAKTPYSGAVDQYSLAVTVYETLCGRRPFGGKYERIVFQQVHSKPPALRDARPDLSPMVIGAVHRALSKQPRQRFPNCHSFAEAVISGLVEQKGGNAIMPAAKMPVASSATVPVPSPPALKAIPVIKRRRRRIVPIGLSVLLVIGLLVGSIFWLTPDEKKRPLKTVFDPTGGFRFVHFGQDRTMVALIYNRQSEKPGLKGTHFARVYDASNGAPLTPQLNHSDEIYDAYFSPDGTKLVTGRLGKTVRVWEISSTKGIAIAQLEHSNGVNQFAFSPDSTKVVTASSDKTAKIWDATKGDVIATLQHSAEVYRAAFSPDGTMIVTCSGDHIARIWDADKVEKIVELKHSGHLNDATFSPDGCNVATASDKIVRVWNATNGVALFDPIKHEGRVSRVNYSPDGELVVTIGEFFGNTKARICDARTGIEKSRLDTDVLYGSFSGDNRKVVTTSRKGIARIWIVRSNDNPALQVFDHQIKEMVFPAAFSPDGTKVVTRVFLASGKHLESKGFVWDANSGKLLNTIAISP